MVSVALAFPLSPVLTPAFQQLQDMEPGKKKCSLKSWYTFLAQGCQKMPCGKFSLSLFFCLLHFLLNFVAVQWLSHV